MPRRVQRIGDFNTHGGAILFPMANTNVFANFRLIANGFSLVAPHFKCPADPKHCAATTVPLGIGGVFINGLPIVAELDTDTCGDMRVLGSLNVFIGP